MRSRRPGLPARAALLTLLSAIVAAADGDPLGAYLRGRELFLREFGPADGAGWPAAAELLPDRRTPRLRSGRAGSCALCHNVPSGCAGAGATIGLDGEGGRSTPHLYGAGLVEAIGASIRLRLMALVDDDRDGVVAVAEAGTRRAVLDVDGIAVDYGAFADRDGDGRPDLDPCFHVWYLDGSGRRLPHAASLRAPGVAGYAFAPRVFGWSSRGAEGTGLRGFIVGALAAHAGLQARDDGAARERPGGWAEPTTSGAERPFAGAAPDPARTRDAAGTSLDDPDRDGVAEEIGVAQLDALERFLLDHPQPIERGEAPGFARGRALFTAMGCARCHIPDWPLLDGAGTALPDRRALGATPTRDGFGQPAVLIGAPPARDARVRGVYSDFRHHDLGPAFHQRRYDGVLITRFRTPPLWGVGTSAPYGHDGASLDLDAVIRRHGGSALAEREAYAALPGDDRDALLAFLRALALPPVLPEPR